MPDPVTVDHGGLTVTTNTATEADLRAELTRGDAAPETATPALPLEGTASEPPPKERDEKGRFVKRDPDAATAPATAAPSEPPPPAEEKPAHPRHDPIMRMKQAVERQAAAERRAAALEAELARLRQPVTAPVTPPEYGAPQNSGQNLNLNGNHEPQFEQFAQEPDPYTAYMQAWARWDHARQIDERFARYQAEQAAKAQHETFTARVKEGAQKYPDWQEALTQADTLGLQVSAVMTQAITQSPRAADVVHFLATHPEECIQLAEESIQTPVDAAPVMRRLLESRLAPAAAASNGAGTASRALTSTAKPPVTPVGSSPVVSDAPPGDDASAAEHARYWNRKLKVPGTR
jgi:hypothetical protein